MIPGEPGYLLHLAGFHFYILLLYEYLSPKIYINRYKETKYNQFTKINIKECYENMKEKYFLNISVKSKNMLI